MAKVQPDLSFVRENRSLEDWLRDLTAPDAPTRLAAGEALQAMQHGVPSIHTDLAEIDWGGHTAMSNQGDRFNDAVRLALKTSNLVADGFVHRLIRYRMMLADGLRRKYDAAFAREKAPNVHRDRLLQRLEAAEGEDERAEASHRYLRWTCAKMDRDLRTHQGFYARTESTSPPGFMAFVVFRALDLPLLADRDGLRAMLADGSLRSDAVEALTRIGPPAVDFAPEFFRELDATSNGYFAGAQALGSIGRDDPNVVDGLLKRLRKGTVAIRSGAATALAHAGPSLAGRLPIALDLLLGASHEPELVVAAIPALASIGRDDEAAFRRVLELAEPRPPRLRRYEGFDDQEYDEVMVERGAAINALSRFKGFADRAVKALAAAFDTFEEYDPDWSYDGDHERVCHALEAFGPLAAPVVPRIVHYLEEWSARSEGDREWPKAAFRLIVAIGPPALAALPLLERLRADQMDDEPVELDPFEPLDQAILGLRPKSAK